LTLVKSHTVKIFVVEHAGRYLHLLRRPDRRRHHALLLDRQRDPHPTQLNSNRRFQELVRYSACLGEDNSDLQKALELMLSVPHRAQDDKFTSNIEGYRGSIHKLGRLLAHDWFSVTLDDVTKERYLFLFKGKILICKVRRISEDRSVFQLKDIIQVRPARL
jgi:hypothetical protein